MILTPLKCFVVEAELVCPVYLSIISASCCSMISTVAASTVSIEQCYLVLVLYSVQCTVLCEPTLYNTVQCHRLCHTLGTVPLASCQPGWTYRRTGFQLAGLLLVHREYTEHSQKSGEIHSTISVVITIQYLLFLIIKIITWSDVFFGTDIYMNIFIPY